MNNNQKTVKLKFNSKIIDQLGTDMYQHLLQQLQNLFLTHGMQTQKMSKSHTPQKILQNPVRKLL